MRHSINQFRITIYLKAKVMSKIKIKYFGPIKKGYLENNGWIEIKRTTVFIGNQGSGKSTIAKLISTFIWIEKALVRGDYNIEWFERKNRLKNRFLNYHRLENYLSSDNSLSENTEIEYVGEAYDIKYKNGDLSVKKIPNSKYSLSQIMYVPAERNFIAYVKSSKELKLSSESLKEFLTEYDNAKKTIKKEISLPINDAYVEYDKLNDIVNVKTSAYKVKLNEASSGFQSLVPLFLVSEYLSKTVKKIGENNESMTTKEMERFKKEIENILSNNDLTEEQKRIAISVLSSRFNKTSFINIVEEPEQNLFPTSQWQLLKSLLKFNNSTDKNKLIITTHSPYIINFLSIAIQADYLKNQIKSNQKLQEKLNAVIPLTSAVNSKEVSIYQFDEKEGVIMKLRDYEGIPSDSNYLNNSLKEANELFDKLLEIEQEL